MQNTNTAKEDHRTQIEKIKKRINELKKKRKPGQTLEAILKNEMDGDNFPPLPTPNKKTNDVCYTIINEKDISTAYTGLTGRFPMSLIVGTNTY